MNLIHRLLLAAALAFTFAAPAAACPLCKESIPEAEEGVSDHDPDRLARAYNYSIFAFIGLPFGMAGVIGYVVYRIHRGETASHGPTPGA